MRRTASVLAILATAVAGPVAFAQDAAAPEAAPDAAHVEYREKVMKSIGANMGAVGHIMKHKLPHQGNIAVHAQAIQLSSTLIESAFEKPAMDDETESLPAIWERWDEYLAAAKSLETASATLAEAATSGDPAAIGQAVRGVGQACGSCHDAFRKQKE